MCDRLLEHNIIFKQIEKGTKNIEKISECSDVSKSYKIMKCTRKKNLSQNC